MKILKLNIDKWAQNNNIYDKNKKQWIVLTWSDEGIYYPSMQCYLIYFVLLLGNEEKKYFLIVLCFVPRKT